VYVYPHTRTFLPLALRVALVIERRADVVADLNTMDVTRDNFTAVLDELLERIDTCEFYAVDLEMTGISTTAHPETAQMSLQQLYQAKRHVAGRYSIIQVGICLMEKRGAGAAPKGGNRATEYDARCYNIFVFPSEDELRGKIVSSERAGGAEGDVVLSPSAISFLRQHGLDFQRWIYRGVPYVDAKTAQEIRVQVADKRRQARDPDAPSPSRNLTESEKAWFDAALEKVRGLTALPAGVTLAAPSVELPLPPIQSAAACAALRAAVEREEALSSSIEVVVHGRMNNKNASLRRRSRYDVEWEEKRLLTDRLGFQLVFEALARSMKPWVTHNGMADLMFLHDAFIGPLPSSVNDFASSMREAFHGNFYDTKYICSYLPTSIVPHGRFDNTALGSLYAAYGPNTNAIRLRFPEGFHQYHPETMRHRRGGSGAHEAGYDAMMTAAVFANACEEFPGARRAAKDKVAVFGSLDALDLNLAAKAPSPEYDVGAVRVARGDVLAVEHPWGTNVSQLKEALPCAHQFIFPVDAGRAILALEPQPASIFTAKDPIAAAVAAAKRPAKPFMSAAELTRAIEAAAGVAAESDATRPPLAKVKVAPFTQASFPQAASTSADQFNKEYQPATVSWLRATVNRGLRAAARRLPF
jgi:poly(A)-specific ribonuclease